MFSVFKLIHPGVGLIAFSGSQLRHRFNWENHNDNTDGIQESVDDKEKAKTLHLLLSRRKLEREAKERPFSANFEATNEMNQIESNQYFFQRLFK